MRLHCSPAARRPHSIRLSNQTRQDVGSEDIDHTLAVEQSCSVTNRMRWRSVCSMKCCFHCSAKQFSPIHVQPIASIRAFKFATSIWKYRTDVRTLSSAMLELFVVCNSTRATRRACFDYSSGNAHLWVIAMVRQHPRTIVCSWRSARAGGVTHELRRMNTYGVLGRYIPTFRCVVGRMQYDLFPCIPSMPYAVRCKQLRRLAMRKSIMNFPTIGASCSRYPSPRSLISVRCPWTSPKVAVAIIRNSGSVDSEISAWNKACRVTTRACVLAGAQSLVVVDRAEKRYQRSKVVNAFAQLVGDQTHLINLYMLTVADVRGTNPNCGITGGFVVCGVLRSR